MAGLLEDWDERSQRLSDDMSAYGEGDINTAQMALRTAGETVGGLGDVIGVATEPAISAAMTVVPDMVKEGVAEMARGVMDTGPVKYATKWLQEHPEQARDLSMAANAAELLPWGKLAKGGAGDAMNAGIQEVATDLPGFYAGPAGAVKAFSQGVVDGAPNALKTAVSPQMRANRREIGTGQTRVDEFLNHPKESTVRGTALASSMMGKQIDNRTADKTIMDFLPTTQNEIAHISAGDKAGAMEAFRKAAPDMPDHIAEKFYDRNTKALAGTYGLLGSVLPKVSNLGKQGDKLSVVRNLDAPGSKLRPETIGQGQVGGRAHQWMRNQKMIDRQENRLGRPMESLEDVQEYMTVASAFERGRWERLKQALPEGERGKGKSVLFEDYMDAKHVDSTKDVFTPKQRAEFDKLLTKVDRGEATVIQEAKMNKMMDALAAGAVTPRKKKLVETMDKWLDENKPNIAVDPDDPSILWYTTSYTSGAQELGGVGQRMAIDTKNKQIYNSVLDGHDMFGMDPAGGVGLDTLVPPVQQGYGNAFVNLKTPDAATSAEWQHMVRLGEKTGIPPKVERYKTGPKKGQLNPNSREKARAYEKRVLTEYQANPNVRDYFEAGTNVGSVGLLAMPNSEVQDEGRGY